MLNFECDSYISDGELRDIRSILWDISGKWK